VFINVPKYLIVKVKEERKVEKNGKKVIEYKSGVDMNLMEIESITIGKESFSLSGIVCSTGEVDRYFTLVKREGVWMDNLNLKQIKNTNVVTKGIDVLYYVKN